MNQTVKTTIHWLATNIAGAMIFFVAIGALSPEQSAKITASAHNIIQDSKDIVGNFAVIWYIIFPLASAALLKMGINATDVGNMVDRVLKVASSDTPQAPVAKAAILEAAANLESK